MGQSPFKQAHDRSLSAREHEGKGEDPEPVTLAIVAEEVIVRTPVAIVNAAPLPTSVSGIPLRFEFLVCTCIQLTQPASRYI